MSDKLTWNTSIPDREVFAIGWFQFPVNIDKNYGVVVVFHDVLVVLSFLTNPILLFIIVKTFGSSSGKNPAILLGSICLINVLVASFGLMALIGSFGIDSGIMTMSFVSVFSNVLCDYLLFSIELLRSDRYSIEIPNIVTNTQNDSWYFGILFPNLDLGFRACFHSSVRF